MLNNWSRNVKGKTNLNTLIILLNWNKCVTPYSILNKIDYDK